MIRWDLAGSYLSGGIFEIGNWFLSMEQEQEYENISSIGEDQRGLVVVDGQGWEEEGTVWVIKGRGQSRGLLSGFTFYGYIIEGGIGIVIFVWKASK